MVFIAQKGTEIKIGHGMTILAVLSLKPAPHLVREPEIWTRFAKFSSLVYHSVTFLTSKIFKNIPTVLKHSFLQQINPYNRTLKSINYMT